MILNLPRGILHQIFSNKGSVCDKKWTQSDLRFCKNDGSKRSMINDKRGQLDPKIKEKIETK